MVNLDTMHMRKVTNFDLIKRASYYFELPAEEKEYLQHYLWDLVQDYRSDLIKHGGDVTSLEIYSDLLYQFKKKENYYMCGLIQDSALRYEIDLI